MSRVWMSGFAFVSLIAAVKTYLVVQLLLPSTATTLATTSGLFALFFALTGVVAYICFTQIRGHYQRVRKERLTPGGGDPVAKETIVLNYAKDWGLSQAEADVAIFVVKGFSNTEIADMRGCAVATVKSQLGKIYNKSGLENRYQLTAFVTDEVCSMARHSEKFTEPRKIQNVLPLVGASRKAA